MRTTGTNIDVVMAFTADEPHDMTNGNGSLRVVVYSDKAYLFTYGVKLAIRYRLEDGDVIFVNPRKYSLTSTKHKGDLWRALYYKTPNQAPSWGGRHWAECPELNKEMVCESAWRIGRSGEPLMEWEAWVPIMIAERIEQQKREEVPA